jgi:hypothetical protein
MKKKSPYLLALVFFISFAANSQYKDLEGVFFGKVISIGPAVSYRSFGDKALGSTVAISPIVYNVHFNSKASMWMSFSLPKKMTVNSTLNDGMTDYTRQDEFKLWGYEFGYRFAITPGGTDKPTSAFLNLSAGYLSGKHTTLDSRYPGGDFTNTPTSQLLIGGGVTVFQRLGERFLLFAEPTYKYNLSMSTHKVFLDDMYERDLKFSHINAQFGILYLIGRKG